jgi:hypothetical protein
MLRDAFAIGAAGVKHRFCNAFRGLNPMEFSAFFFQEPWLDFTGPSNLREAGKNWGLHRLSTARSTRFIFSGTTRYHV